MRCLDRDRRLVWLSPYLGREPLRDAQGRLTGEWEVRRGDPVPLLATVGPPSGEAASELFGTGVEYDRTVTFPDPRLAADEHSALWLGDGGWEAAYGPLRPPGGECDHRVVAVRRTRMFTVLAVRRVEGSA